MTLFGQGEVRGVFGTKVSRPSDAGEASASRFFFVQDFFDSSILSTFQGIITISTSINKMLTYVLNLIDSYN